MLDAFLEVAYEHEKRASDYQELVQNMTKLPMKELHSLAQGKSKLAYLCGDGEKWLDKFVGTPFHEEALALEQQSLELEIAREQKRLAEAQEEDSERAERDEQYRQEDAIRLKKRILDLELNKSKLQGAGGEESEDEEEEEEGEEEAPEEEAAEEAGEDLKQAAARMRKAAAAVVPTQQPPASAADELAEAEALGRTVGGASGALMGGFKGYQIGGRVGGIPGRALGALAGAGLGTALGGTVGGSLARTAESPVALGQAAARMRKAAAVLDTAAREKIKSKNFAVKTKGGEEKYPVNDPKHAKNALTRVRQFGTPSEKSKVYSAVAKKYPALATRSSVIPEKKQRTAEKKLGLPKGGESQRQEKAVQKVSGFGCKSASITPEQIGRMRKEALNLSALGTALKGGAKALGVGARQLGGAARTAWQQGAGGVAQGGLRGVGQRLGNAAGIMKPQISGLTQQAGKWISENPGAALGAGGILGAGALGAGGVLGRATS